jgi:hypothetical protein
MKLESVRFEVQFIDTGTRVDRQTKQPSNRLRDNEKRQAPKLAIKRSTILG